MNDLLSKGAPWSVMIAEHSYSFDADFRNFIKFEQLITDERITDEVLRYALMIRLFYEEAPPAGYEEVAINHILDIYKGGLMERPKDRSIKAKERIYDFSDDAEFIYSAFYADYNIDLLTVPRLHWWTFKMLFIGLKPDNLITKIMEYRAADISKMKGEQKQHYQKMKNTYKLKTATAMQDKRLKLIQERLLAGQSIEDLI